MTETPVQEWAFNPAEILASTRKVQGIFHQPVVDKDGELITPKGMREAVPDFMHLPALHDFHKERPVGLATKVKELSGGRFWFEGVIKSTPDCDDIWEKVKTGNYDQVSIFGKRTKYNNQCSLPQNMRSGTCITDGVRLDSISVCDENARNPQTSLEVKKAKVVFDADCMKAETTGGTLQHSSTDYAGGRVRIKKCPRCKEDPNTISKDDVEKSDNPDQPYKFKEKQPAEVREKRPGDKKKQMYPERAFDRANKHTQGKRTFHEPMATIAASPVREPEPQKTKPAKKPDTSSGAKRTTPVKVLSIREPMDTIATHKELPKKKPSPKSEAPPEGHKGNPEDRGHISGNRYSYKVREAEPRHKGTSPKDNPPKGHSPVGEEEGLPYKTVDGKRQPQTPTKHTVYGHPGTKLGGNQVTPPNEEMRTNVQQTHGKKLETRSAKLARMYPDAPQPNSPHETPAIKQERSREEQLKENRNRQKRDNRALAKEEKKADDEMTEEDMEKGRTDRAVYTMDDGRKTKSSHELAKDKGVNPNTKARRAAMVAREREKESSKKPERDIAEEKQATTALKNLHKGAAEDLEDESYDEDEDKDFEHAKPTDKEGQWSKNKDPNGTVKMSKAQKKGKPKSEDEEEEESEEDEEEEEEQEDVEKGREENLYRRARSHRGSGEERPRTTTASSKTLKTNRPDPEAEAGMELGTISRKKMSSIKRESRESKIKKGDEDAASESFNPSTVTKGEQMDDYEENDVEYVTKALVPIEEIDTIVKARTEEISKAYVAQLDEIKKAYDTKFVELSSKIEKMENETIRKGGSVVVIPELLSGNDGSSSNADALARMMAGR